MKLLENLINKFFTRDLYYIIGGASIILSFLFYYNIFPFEKDIASYLVIFILLISYVIGYLIQELFSLFRIVRTTLPRQIKIIDGFLYWIFVGKKCESRGTNRDYQKLDTDLKEAFNEKNMIESLSQFKRIISLKQIGATIGSNWLICSIIILLKYFNDVESASKINILILGVVIFIFSLVAIVINRIKLANQIESIYQNLNLIDNKDN
jgi:UDP-N-acetylmuramyl pentapeptide phosphotransferase/UDP-N-acetylglucosamine-1-phosphate transferase